MNQPEDSHLPFSPLDVRSALTFEAVLLLFILLFAEISSPPAKE